MNNELMARLNNGILSAIIVLFFAAIISMLIGYRIVAKHLAQRGMKKVMQKPLGKQRHRFCFC